MQNIRPQSIDLILADLPYNTTRNSWDCEIDSEQLWELYQTIIKPNGCIALWGQGMFAHKLAMSNPNWFKYEWVIEKTKATGHLNARKMPMKAHESVLIFYDKLPVYNPQKTIGHTPVHSFTKHTDDGSTYGKTKIGISGGGSTERYPRDVLKFKWDTQKSSLHQCQKPVEALEYFIKTYTNEGDLVLDNTAGSCSTAIACLNTDRDFICIEKDRKIYQTGVRRVLQYLSDKEIDFSSVEQEKRFTLYVVKKGDINEQTTT